MGMMDRDWYRERFARKTLEIEGPLDDAFGEPARIRLGVSKPWRPPLPRGAAVGEFWSWLWSILSVILLLLWGWLKWRG